MYLQITSKCNMACDHCCMSCEPGKGEHMSMEIVEASLAYLGDDYMTIGGGEPTLHPNFYEILCRCIGASELVFIVTNGSITDKALLLAKMASTGVIAAALSRDVFHDPIEEVVIEAFTSPELGSYAPTTDLREIRDVTYNVYNVGRAVETKVYVEEGCACEDFFIYPDGTIKVCGCPDAPIIGHVLCGGLDEGDRWISGECHTSNNYRIKG